MANNFEDQKLEKDVQEIQKKISDLVQEFDNKWSPKGHKLTIRALYDPNEMREHNSMALCMVNGKKLADI